MSRNKATLLGLPDVLRASIVRYLDRDSLNSFCETNKSLCSFLKSDDSFFDKWPRMDELFCEQTRREVVYITKSPNNKKLCAIIREYNKPGKMIVFDIKKGPISTLSVSADFRPVFSPNSDLIIGGAPGVGILIGRIAKSAHTRASAKEDRDIISWNKFFTNCVIRGVTFINHEEVWISHKAGRLILGQLSPNHVYSFTVTKHTTNTYGITVSPLSQSAFMVPVTNRNPESELNVDVVHQHPYTAVNVHGRWTLTRQLFVCKHVTSSPGYELINIPLAPRLNIEVGMGMSIAFSPGARSLIGVGCDRGYQHSGRFVTFFDNDAQHNISEGPYQNFTRDLCHFDEYGPPKIWYYDGAIIVYSKPMAEDYVDQHDPDETQLTNEERTIMEWDETRLSPPRAYYIRGKVSADIKEKINRAQINMTYNVFEYYDMCKLTPFLIGWTPEMWNLILNGKVYS